MQRRCLWATVEDAYLDEDVFRGRLGIFNKHVKVAILIEYPCVEQFVLEVVSASAAAGYDQVTVRVRRLWILVEVFHVRMGRRGIEVEVVLLHVLAMIPLTIGQAE